ncbi:MAG: phosphate ABC transporter substrate-binding protein [Betaproteobacteria bacterium]|nr:phosphate ABC transporter substrate-binding protein [Betaproteobacteria bacterium]
MRKSWIGRFSSVAAVAGLAVSIHAQAADRVVLDGSTGVMPLASALAKAFQAKNPDAAFEFGKGLGTKARIQALADGKIDIALASHGLKVEEITRQGMSVHEVARIAVVFGVNDSVPVANLTGQQICDIYSGKVTNWKALGGPDLEITVRTRPDSEVDTEVVRAGIACLKDLKMAESVKAMPKSGDMARELAAVPGGIGMTSMTVVEQSKGSIKAVSLSGVAPSADNVRRKAYTLIRESFFVTKASPSPAVARFLEFTRSASGDDVIAANGAVPAR